MPLLSAACALAAAALAAEGDGPFTHRTQPLEAVTAPSAELVERLRRAPPLRAEVVRGAAGGPALRLDGRAAPILGAQQMGLGYAKDRIHIQPYLDGGIRLIMVSVNAGFQHPDSGHAAEARHWPSFWEGAGRFRPEVVEPELWRTVAMDPEAALLVRIWMTPYPRWTAEHPEAVIRNLHGHPLVVSSHFLRFDPAGPSPDPARHEQLAGSFHSEALVADMERATGELVRAVEASVPGRRVAGYFVGGGQDGQLYDWAPPDGDLARDAALWNDFSPAAQAAWRRWLERRYASPQALGAAWGRAVAAFAEAPLPAAGDLVGAATLHHPVRGRIAMDWNRFTADARGELVARLARAAKRAAGRPVVVGAPAGWSARKDLAQAA
ncbi:MAG: beta-galactosidase, partial [Planctomycetes bacterium]|nr:beta-galactosidase [Planctomycetota bacterium]